MKLKDYYGVHMDTVNCLNAGSNQSELKITKGDYYEHTSRRYRPRLRSEYH